MSGVIRVDGKLRSAFLERLPVERGDGCWLWMGSVNGRGYGRVKRSGRDILAHRLSWVISRGRQIPHGLLICHRCDVKTCVNPSHLYAGTPRENTLDWTRNPGYVHRDCRGERNGRARLSRDDVRAIRRMAKTGASPRDLARTHAVSVNHVRNILSGIAWSHVRP